MRWGWARREVVRATYAVVVADAPRPLDRLDLRADRVELVPDPPPAWTTGADLVVIADTRPVKRLLRTLARCAPAVREGGRLLVLCPPDRARALQLSVADVVAREQSRERQPKWARELARGIGPVTTTRAGLRIDKRVPHLALLRDDEVIPVLQRRNDLTVRVLETRPAGAFTSTTKVSSWPDGTGPETSGAQDFPRMTLRRYDGPVTLGRAGLVHTDHLALPESFKWQGAKLHQPRVRVVEGTYGRVTEPEPAPQRLDGSFYFLDYAHPGHYGHLMTEALAKLWGWERARSDDPDLRLLLRRHPRDAERSRPRPDAAVLAAYGIPESELTWVDGPVRVDRLVGATPMWHNNEPFHAHPDMREVWSRLRRGFADPGAPPGPELVFVTRREGNRPCRNVDRVEGIFADHGFTVVRPGGLTPAEQAHTFADARVVAGFGGTGMFNLVHASGLTDVIVLNHDAYAARNEHLMALLMNADVHYFWSRADLRPDAPGGYYDAYQSPWEFDLAANRHRLEALLGQLG